MEAREGFRLPGTGATGGDELPDVDPGDCELPDRHGCWEPSSGPLLTSEPSH